MEQNTTIHSPDFLKRQAKALRKGKGISHSNALDEVVQAEGFRNWAHYLKTLKDHASLPHKRNQGYPNTCALCGLTTTTLRSSHYLAAAFSRRLHGEEQGKVVHPISLNAKRAMYDCSQAQAKLLCEACERRFAVQGENWIIECTSQKDGRFPLRDILLQTPPIYKVGPTAMGRVAHVFAGGKSPDIRHGEIIYFAVSVFWRGWAFDWSSVSELSQLEFPTGLGDQFRDFLLGKSPFPESVVLQVEVALNPLLGAGSLGMIFPDRITPRIPNATAGPVGYFFAVFGLTFMLYFDLGKAAGLRTKAISIAEPPHAISLTDVRMLEVNADYNRLESTAKRVGKLARRQFGASK